LEIDSVQIRASFNIGLVSKLPLVLLHFGKHLNLNGRVKMLLVKISIGHFRIQHFSKLMKFIAKAAIPDAEEAPELWERILCRL
jgi:hypothetical protein